MEELFERYEKLKALAIGGLKLVGYARAFIYL